jgi:hypothetical protein
MLVEYHLVSLKSGSPLRAAFAAALALLTLLACSARASADGSLGPNGTPITTSSYALDLFHGPVFAGSRVTGLAGSYVAISEDVDGDIQNPASPAVRPFFSYSYFDYWIGFGLTFPATLSNTDFFNSGSKTNVANAPDSFVFFTPSLNLQWGEFGIGANIEVQQYALSSSTTDDKSKAIAATIPTIHLQLAHGLAHNQLVLGVGARLVSMSVRESLHSRAMFASNGTGIELGAVYKPERMPYRLGAAFRTGIRTTPSYRQGLLPNEQGDLVVTNEDGSQSYLPEAVAFPWDLNFGAAVQFGPRPINPPWRTTAELSERDTLMHRVRQLDRETKRDQDLLRAKTPQEKREIEQAFDKAQRDDDEQLDQVLANAQRRIESDLLGMNRFYVQVSASMLISGPVEEAVGVESLVSQTVNRSGQHTVFSPRLGIESGVIPKYLKLRVGTYLEPTRFEGSEARMHFTAGLDVRLLRWNVFGAWPDDYIWRLGLGLDVASRYSTWGITLAGWYPRHNKPDEFTQHTESPTQ